MIWNDKVLFIHTPKTAGMSLTQLLADSLPRPVYITEPVEAVTVIEGVSRLPGFRHEQLGEAATYFDEHNGDLSEFEKIFVVMRNPYDLELSRYAYLRKDLPQDRGKAQAIALAHDYRHYLKEAPFFGYNPPRLDLYFHIDGAIPDNLRILRFESLLEDIAGHLAPYLDPDYELPHHNASPHEHFSSVYDAEMEQLCYDRNRWFFDQGFYERLAFG